LIGSYIILRGAAPSWPNPLEVLNVPLTAFNTFLLIVSSATLVKALAAAQDGDTEGMQVGLFLTILIGILFLSIQVIEYKELMHERHLYPSSSLFGSCFYTMTSFHGAHVAIGVGCLIFTWIRSLQGKYTKEDSRGIEVVGLYWHFVDLVWIILFTIVYLM